MKRLAALAAIFGAGVLVVAGAAFAATDPGFKTAKPAYLVPIAPGVATDPIISTGDVVGGYQMSGIPDGLGAFKDNGDTLQLFMNHELGISFPGVPPGVDARISNLTLNRQSHGVLAGRYSFTGAEGFERFCSATLATISQADNTNDVTLKAAARAAGAFRFARLEDAAVAYQKPGRVFFSDTGKAGEATLDGRIYRLDVDPSDPTHASLTVVLDSLV